MSVLLAVTRHELQEQVQLVADVLGFSPHQARWVTDLVLDLTRYDPTALTWDELERLARTREESAFVCRMRRYSPLAISHRESLEPLVVRSVRSAPDVGEVVLVSEEA